MLPGAGEPKRGRRIAALEREPFQRKRTREAVLKLSR